jgi:PRTRC genetic system ThiF family protein
MIKAIRAKTGALEHRISEELLQKKVRVTVVGCGGTGSAIAAGLPSMHQAMLALGHPYGLDVTFVDGEKVSLVNCVRQPFSESEVGFYKALILATRINQFYGLRWRGVPDFVDEHWRDESDILIGCVDSREARRRITSTRAHAECHYYLDIGNNADSGQFILGQPLNQRNKASRQRLPTVAELFPELINPKLDKKDKLPSCSAVEALQRQEPFVNSVLANLSLAMLARLFRYGRLQYHGAFVPIETGRTAPLRVDPSQWRRIAADSRS